MGRLVLLKPQLGWVLWSVKSSPGPQDIMDVSVSIAVAWSQSRGGHSEDAAFSSALTETQADMRLLQHQSQSPDVTIAITHGIQPSATGAHC